MTKIQSLSLFLALGSAFLSVGTVVKKKDPVLETQTGPIGYAEKAKEEAEGKKGPPAPTLELYPKERFLIEGPVEKRKRAFSAKEEAEVELWLEEEGEEEDETPEDEELWEGREKEGWFKLEAKRDDTREKPAKPTPRFLDTSKG